MQHGSMTGILDHKGVGILKPMRSDSRKPVGTVGGSQAVSKATAGRRAAKMGGEGIIRRHNPDTDRWKTGVRKPSVAVQTAGAPVSVMTDNLKAHKRIGRVCESSGDLHMMLGMRTKNTDGLCGFIQTGLLNMPAARNAEADVLTDRTSFNNNPDLRVHGTKIKGKG